MAKEKFERNEPPVNMGIIDSTDRGRATNMVRVGTIEGGIVEITETGDAMRAGVEAFQKLIDEGQAGDNVGLSLRGTKIDQPDIASVSAFGWGVEMFMPGDNATINVELITSIEMEKELCFAIY